MGSQQTSNIIMKRTTICVRDALQKGVFEGGGAVVVVTSAPLLSWCTLHHCGCITESPHHHSHPLLPSSSFLHCTAPFQDALVWAGLGGSMFAFQVAENIPPPPLHWHAKVCLSACLVFRWSRKATSQMVRVLTAVASDLSTWWFLSHSGREKSLVRKKGMDGLSEFVLIWGVERHKVLS